jgi:hypothetical protein
MFIASELTVKDSMLTVQSCIENPDHVGNKERRDCDNKIKDETKHWKDIVMKMSKDHDQFRKEIIRQRNADKRTISSLEETNAMLKRLADS